ncbi:hypothetical protein AOXY_G30709 [Acipenser oxyrinchus oxyrinchus]|uniref:Uncharacterized protein n=1 Tax=Acipenser oxyrinchus oxyrinchus TaxID=40147 RepID=A0AAD8CK24_ACIOX|nr:hypothetical protein AOXY_G30709 [Acipenser oxyrinchus oxyrinchus]
MEPPQQNFLDRLSQTFWTAFTFIQQAISNIFNPENEQPNEAEQILPAERAAGQEDVTTGVSRPGNRQEAAATAECCHGDQEAEVALTRQTDFETPAVSCHGARKRNAQGVVAGGRAPGVQWDLRGTEQVKTHKEVCSSGEVSKGNRQREVTDSKSDITEPSEERVPEEGCRDSRQEAAPGGQDVGDTEVRGHGGQEVSYADMIKK